MDTSCSTGAVPNEAWGRKEALHPAGVIDRLKHLPLNPRIEHTGHRGRDAMGRGHGKG